MNQKPHVQKLLQMQKALTDSDADTSHFLLKETLLKLKPALRNEPEKILVLCRTRGSGLVRPKSEVSSRAVSFCENTVSPGSIHRCLGIILKAGLDS